MRNYTLSSLGGGGGGGEAEMELLPNTALADHMEKLSVPARAV